MSVSLKDIADLLGVSKTTVSWVLSGNGEERGISQATQEKVRMVARELGYTPNLIARGLNTGTTNTIGLIVPDITDSFYSEVVVCIEKRAEKLGYNVLIGNSESKIERENNLIKMFRSRQADGIIIAPTKISHTEIDRLIKDHIPFVLFDRYFPEIKTNYVIVDNYDSSYKLVKALIKRGCKKIAFITTNSHLKTMNMRYEGYQKALKESGIPVNQSLLGDVPFENYQSEIRPVLNRILKEVPDVDAFFFTTHILCLSAFYYFYEKHVSPSHYELACIHVMPALTCMAPEMLFAFMPVEEIGKIATDILWDNINFNKKYPNENFRVRSVICQCTYPNNTYGQNDF